MPNHNFKWLNKRTLVLNENEIERVRLVYPIWPKAFLYPQKPLIVQTANGNTFELKPSFGWGCTLVAGDKTYIKAEWNWLTQIDVRADMPDFSGKLKISYRFFFPKSAELINENKKVLLRMNSRFNWRRFSFEYSIQFLEDMPSGETGDLIAMICLYYFRMIIIFYW